MTKDELLAALLVERQDQTWWKRAPSRVGDHWEKAATFDDHDLNAARRRAAMVADFDRLNAQQRPSGGGVLSGA